MKPLQIAEDIIPLVLLGALVLFAGCSPSDQTCEELLRSVVPEAKPSTLIQTPTPAGTKGCNGEVGEKVSDIQVEARWTLSGWESGRVWINGVESGALTPENLVNLFIGGHPLDRTEMILPFSHSWFPAPDGAPLIAIAYNRRNLLFSDGKETARPFPDDMSVLEEAVAADVAANGIRPYQFKMAQSYAEAVEVFSMLQTHGIEEVYFLTRPRKKDEVVTDLPVPVGGVKLRLGASRGEAVRVDVWNLEELWYEGELVRKEELAPRLRGPLQANPYLVVGENWLRRNHMMDFILLADLVHEMEQAGTPEVRFDFVAYHEIKKEWEKRYESLSTFKYFKRMSLGNAALEATYAPMPDLTPHARTLERISGSGSMEFELIVNEQGAVVDARLYEPLTRELELESLMLEQLRTWRFNPVRYGSTLGKGRATFRAVYQELRPSRNLVPRNR